MAISWVHASARDARNAQAAASSQRREADLGEVVDELAVDEAVDAVPDDGLALGAHLVLLSLLNVSDLRQWSTLGFKKRMLRA